MILHWKLHCVLVDIRIEKMSLSAWHRRGIYLTFPQQQCYPNERLQYAAGAELHLRMENCFQRE